MDVPVARRTERPTWINVRTVLGLLLFSLSLLLGHRLLADARTAVPVWAATRDLPGGHAVAAGDLHAVDVRMGPEVIAGYVTASTSLEGAILSEAVGAGELIASEWVGGSAESPGRDMSVPVAPEHAVGGALTPGDRVDLFVTLGAGEASARTVLLAGGVEVLEVVTAGGLVLGEEAVIGVTVAVAPEIAGRLTFAIRNGDIDVVKVSGSASSEGVGTVTGEEFE